MIPFPPFDGFPEDAPAGRWPPPADPPTHADTELALLVAGRLQSALKQPGQRIMIEVQNRVVVLEGLVTTARLRGLVHELVWRTPGVFDVCNRLSCWNDEADGAGAAVP